MKKHPYDPTPRSPVEIQSHPEYKIMTDYQGDSYYPSACECIVHHKISNTFWKTIYAVREDDSDADCSATWRQVIPEQIIVTKYKDVK